MRGPPSHVDDRPRPAGIEAPARAFLTRSDGRSIEHDDVQIGRILSRPEVLGLLGAGGAAALVTPGTASAADRAAPRSAFRLPACIVRPSQTTGPYFVDTDLDRSDIRSDPTDGSVCEGARLELAFQVSRLDSQRCEPLAGALVDVWQCDAVGIYSSVKDINDRFDTTGERTRNPEDGIFRSGGSQLLLDVTEEGSAYRAVFDIGLQTG